MSEFLANAKDSPWVFHPKIRQFVVPIWFFRPAPIFRFGRMICWWPLESVAFGTPNWLVFPD